MENQIRIIMEKGSYRILEVEDTDYTMDDLKGDMFKPESNTEIAEEQLRKEESDFEELVDSEGVYGYVLEKWNPDIGKGWTHVDSCWGFFGLYRPNTDEFNHYIVEEMKGQIGEQWK